MIHRPQIIISSGRKTFLFSLFFFFFSIKANERGQLTDAEVPAFIEAWAALGTPPVHGPHASPVRRLVADPANAGRGIKHCLCFLLFGVFFSPRQMY